MKSIKTFLFGIFLTSFFTLKAQAGLITNTYDFSGPDSERNVNNISDRFTEQDGTRQNLAVMLNGFDSSFGALTGVSISFSSTVIATMIATSQDTQPEVSRRNCIPFGPCKTTNLYSDDVSIISSLLGETSAYISIGGTQIGSSTSQRYSEFLSCNLSLNNSSNNSCRDTFKERYRFDHTFTFSGLDFASFFSSDLVELNLSSYTGVEGACNSNSEVKCNLFSRLDNWIGSATVQYQYRSATTTTPTAVSEPNHLLLLLLGFFGLGAIQRRN